MARKAREKSTSGIYHVLIRAISDVTLFTDDEDYEFYANFFSELQQKEYGVFYAYALFPTHVHLLVKEGSEPIGQTIKRIATSYSYFYNVKYEHYGPIHLDRFKSQPVESKEFYLKVLDFIGSQDTEKKAILTNSIPSLPQTDPVPLDARKAAIIDFKEREKRITDSRLLAYLQSEHNFTNAGEFLQRDAKEQEEVLIQAKKKGASIRQLVRITGCSYVFAFRAKNASST